MDARTLEIAIAHQYACLDASRAVDAIAHRSAIADQADRILDTIRSEDRDRTGNNGVLFPSSGKWTCLRDETHKRDIFATAGIREEIAPEEKRRRWREAEALRRRERERHRLKEQAKRSLPHLIEKWRWSAAEVRRSSPCDPEEASDPRIFLASVFALTDIVWAGPVYASGARHSGRWRTVEKWLDEDPSRVGPMTTPATWTPGAFQRIRENVLVPGYVVLDFDQIPTTGTTPTTEEERERLVSEALAVLRWLREGRRWELAAILHTGSKSVHAWFRDPGEDALATMRASLRILGIDPSLIGHPEHPVRLPGHMHQKTGRRSRVLWVA